MHYHNFLKDKQTLPLKKSHFSPICAQNTFPILTATKTWREAASPAAANLSSTCFYVQLWARRLSLHQALQAFYLQDMWCSDKRHSEDLAWRSSGISVRAALPAFFAWVFSAGWDSWRLPSEQQQEVKSWSRLSLSPTPPIHRSKS